MIRWIFLSAVTLLTSAYPAGAHVDCVDSNDDDILVEYLNQLRFNGDIEILVQDAGTTFNLTISCPAPIGPSLPAPTIPANVGLGRYATGVACTCQNKSFEKRGGPAVGGPTGP